MLIRGQFSTSTATLFQNGGHLKISNSNKTRIYEPIWMKLSMQIVLAKSRPNFDDQHSKSFYFQNSFLKF